MLIRDACDESRLSRQLGTSLEFREEVWGREFSAHIGRVLKRVRQDEIATE